MKNKKIIIISIIILIATVGIFILSKKFNKSLIINKKTILAEKSYINYAWGFQYKGMAIFNDGTIYEWDFNGNSTDYKVNNSKEHGDWILKNGSKVNKKVSKKDLDEIKKIIVNLENNIDKKNTGNDRGTNTISIWNDNNEKITLKESGDFTGENNSECSQELLKIINNYLK